MSNKKDYTKASDARFVDNRGEVQDNGWVTLEQMERAFGAVSTDIASVVNDLQTMDTELRTAQHLLNTQAFVIDAMSKILVQKEICTAEELNEIIKVTYGALRATDGKVN